MNDFWEVAGLSFLFTIAASLGLVLIVLLGAIFFNTLSWFSVIGVVLFLCIWAILFYVVRKS